MDIRKIDKDILYMLSRDSSMNLTEMSKELKRSKQVLSYNINKLIKEGIIKGFFPIVDYALLGRLWLRILVRFSNTSPSKEREIIEFIKKREEAKRISKVDNYFDLIIDYAGNDMQKLYSLILSLEEKYGKHIIEDYFDIIISQEAFPCRFFRECRERRGISNAGGEKAALDEKDAKILREIEINPRPNYAILSQKIGINPKTIIKRIRIMEKKGIIKGYGIMINWSKLGKVHYKILIDPFIYTRKKFDSLKEAISSNKRVICFREVISKYMIEFDIIVESYNEILESMNPLKENFSDVIRGYDIVHVREEI